MPTLSERCAELATEIAAQTADSLEDYSSPSSNDLIQQLQAGAYSSDEYQLKTIGTASPWIALSALTFIVFVSFTINAIWLRFYPQKAVGFWSCCRRPQTNKGRLPFLIISHILLALIIAACGFGYSVGEPNEENGDKAACALKFLLEDLINGLEDENWAGTLASQTAYANLRDDYDDAVEEFATITFSSEYTEMTDRSGPLKDVLDTLYNTRTNYYVQSSRYKEEGTFVTTDYLENLGPKETVGTYTATLAAEIDQKIASATTSSTNLQVLIPSITGDDEDFGADIKAASENYIYFSSILDDQAQAMLEYIEDNYERYQDENTSIKTAFGFLIACCFMMPVLLLIHHKKKSRTAKNSIYIFWGLLNIWCIIGFAVAADFQFLEQRSTEYCDLFYQLGTDEDFADTLDEQYTTAYSTPLSSCFNDNGETYNNLLNDDSMATLLSVSENILNVEDSFPSADPSQESTTQQAIMDLYIQGLVHPINDEDNRQGTTFAINRLNRWSSYSATGSDQLEDAKCSKTRDFWVLNRTNCTLQEYNPAYGHLGNFGDTVCIGVLDFDDISLSNRYNDETMEGCDPVNDNTISEILINRYTGLSNHFEDAKIKFQRLKDFYKYTYGLENDNFMESVYVITEPIEELNNAGDGYMKNVGSETGITKNSNCNFLRNRMLAANTYICDMSDDIFLTMIVLAGVSAGGLLASVFMYLYLRKLQMSRSLLARSEEEAIKKEGQKV